MSQLRNTVSYLWSAADWLDYAGTRCDGIPVIGTAVGYPLHTTASYLRSAAWGIYYADGEIDSVISQVSSAYSLAQQAYSAAWGTVWQTAQSALSTAASAYNFAAGTVWQAAQSAMQRANDAYNYASGYLLTTIGDIRRSLDYQVARLDSAFWQTVRDWQAGINSLQAQINQMGFSVLSGADVVGWIESSLGYLTGQAIALVGSSAATFAAPLWWCFEKVVAQLSQWEGE